MLRLYNTMTRSVDEFKPMNAPQVKLYTCGPTVYNYAHIGNLRTYVFEDVLRRALKFCNFDVDHVMNVTDVGHLVSDGDEGPDKMEEGAKREGKSVWEISDYYWQSFRRNMADLNILEPDTWCKATDYIQEQIDQIKQLEDNGLTYVIEDGVYFDTSKFPAYGDMARLDIEGQQAGARVETTADKRNFTDFALWKFSPEGQQRLMEWESPWGKGFPGWHIECSAMAMRFFGDQMDIHCGGVDHIKIHHTNEIAQAEGATGKSPWVLWWMHGEFLVLEADKMSKSSGNFITLDTLKDEGIDPLVYRFFLFSAHYRKQLTFTREALQDAAKGFERLKNAVIEIKKQADGDGQIVKSYLEKFREAIENDLNMPQAMAAVQGLVRDKEISAEDKHVTLLVMDDVLGFDVKSMKAEEANVDESIQQLLEQREQARKDKDFATADRIRDELLAQGLEIVDTAEGPKVKQKT